MSRLRLTKIAKPAAPAATKIEIYYDTTGLGTPAAPALQAQDENGNLIMLGHSVILDYRLISVRILTSGTSYTPTAGSRALYVECVGGGGQGGGAATSSTQVSLGGGGGGGAYASKWLTGAAVKNPTTYAIGAGGSGAGTGATGTAGGDTTWDTNVVVAKGGAGGTVMAAGTTNLMQAGGTGGAVGSCVGDMVLGGEDGERGFRVSGTVYNYAGSGGQGVLGGDPGIGAINSAAGATGQAASGYGGSGGAGAATLATAFAGGAGAPGFIRVWEYA